MKVFEIKYECCNCGNKFTRQYSAKEEVDLWLGDYRINRWDKINCANCVSTNLKIIYRKPIKAKKGRGK